VGSTGIAKAQQVGPSNDEGGQFLQFVELVGFVGFVEFVGFIEFVGFTEIATGRRAGPRKDRGDGLLGLLGLLSWLR
jgi:hypothetical protein